MMKLLTRLFLSFLFTGMVFVANAQDAKEIVKKADEKLRGGTSHTEFTLTIIRPNWTRDMSAKAWSKGSEYSLILIMSPARDNGIVFLKREKEIWNWIPSIERTVKMPPSMMMQSWMGSDFTNDDLVKESSQIKDYTHQIVGDSTILGKACYKIELIAKEDAAVVWGKILSWITKDEYLQLRSEFYDEDGYLVNIMRGSKIKNLGGKMLPSVLEMIPVGDEGKKTMIEYHSMTFEEPIADDFFSVNNMKRVR